MKLDAPLILLIQILWKAMVGECIKKDIVKFLVYAHSSNNETVNHLKKIGLVYPDLQREAKNLELEYDKLGGKLNKFKDYVIKNW